MLFFSPIPFLLFACMHTLCNILSSQFLEFIFSDLCHEMSTRHPLDLAITGKTTPPPKSLNQTSHSLTTTYYSLACSFDHSPSSLLRSHFYLHSTGHSIFSVFPTSLLSSFSSLSKLDSKVYDFILGLNTYRRNESLIPSSPSALISNQSLSSTVQTLSISTSAEQSSLLTLTKFSKHLHLTEVTFKTRYLISPFFI